MVITARIVDAGNTIPKNLAPHGLQSEAELMLTLECQNSAADLEKAKESAESITFGVFRGSANLLPSLCGRGFWLPLREITRVSFSRVVAPREPEIQSEPQGEDALFPPVGRFLGSAECGGECQAETEAGCDGRRFSFFPHTCGLAQTEDKEQNVGGANGGGVSQGNMPVYISARTECAICGWKLHIDSGKDVRASVLSHGDIQHVTHKLKRCSGRSCRASHRYNFVWQGGRKMNSARFTDSLGAIFLSDSFGVSVETVELLSHRLFRAKTSFLAEAASICAFAEDDPGRCKAPNVKNLSYYLQKAFFIFSKLRNNAAGVHPSGTLIFPIDDPIQGGDVERVYL